jgi:hypothetical protein
MGGWSRFTLVVVMLLAGCAALRRQNAANAEQLLTEAGFTRQPADAASLATLTPYKLVRQDRDGRISYVCLDPDTCTCVYVGGRQQYSVYRRLELEQRIAADQAWAAGQGGGGALKASGSAFTWSLLVEHRPSDANSSRAELCRIHRQLTHRAAKRRSPEGTPDSFEGATVDLVARRDALARIRKPRSGGPRGDAADSAFHFEPAPSPCPRAHRPGIAGGPGPSKGVGGESEASPWTS